MERMSAAAAKRIMYCTALLTGIWFGKHIDRTWAIRMLRSSVGCEGPIPSRNLDHAAFAHCIVRIDRKFQDCTVEFGCVRDRRPEAACHRSLDSDTPPANRKLKIGGLPKMDPVAAKIIAAGLASVGIGLSAVGVGVVYTMAPDKSKIAGLLLTGGFGAVCLLLVFIFLYGT
jgi:hypothetical protein